MKLTKAIITAMEQEAELIIKKYNLKEEKKMWYMTIYTGERESDEWEEENIILVLSGVGKIHATMATTYLFENYMVDKLINIGVVWNLKWDAIKVWDVILPNTFMQHDVYIPEEIDSLKYLREPIFLEYAIGQDYNLEKFSVILNGICVTGDQFIDKQEIIDDIVKEYSADIVDMEAYAILSVAKTYNALDKCACIKSVSDGADNEAVKNHTENLTFAMENAVAILDFTL